MNQAPAGGSGRGLRVRAVGQPTGGVAAGCWAAAPAAGATAAPARPSHVDMRFRHTTVQIPGARVAEEAYQGDHALFNTPQMHTIPSVGTDVRNSRCQRAPHQLLHQTLRTPGSPPFQPAAASGAARRPAAMAPGSLAAQTPGEGRPQAAHAPRAAKAKAHTQG